MPQPGTSRLSAAPSGSVTAEKVKKYALQWIKLTWFDLLCLLVLGGATLGIFYAPMPFTRNFPITFDQSGDIVYPQWAYPYRGWIIPSWLSGVISIAAPMVIYIGSQFWIRSAWDASNAVLGTVWAVLLAALFQVIIKQLIGGFRPYFLEVCMPDISLAGSRNDTGLNGVGFQRIMYTTEICTQPDAWMMKNAMTSFPSGHSTAAFAGFGFLLLWLNAKLKVWADHKPAFWKLFLTMLPLLAAFFIACSLTIDAAHNWYDIVAGSAIGAIMALAAYRSSYAAVWDWRFNHLPLQPKEAFRYGFDGDFDYAAQTISRSAGWGGKREWPNGQLDSATSSAEFAHRASSIQEIDDLDASSPGQTRRKRRVVGSDDVV